MLNPAARRASDTSPDFWKLLLIFWGDDRVDKWRKSIFADSQNVGVEKCFNLISLTATAHVIWTKGLFALKPLKLSRNRKELTVQFFWQVPGNYKFGSRIDLLTETTSSKGLKKVAPNHFLAHDRNDGSGLRYIQSGEIFTFTTKDPKNLPLPSVELLEMQWVLQRLVGMSGAVGWPSLDDDDDGWLVPDYTDYNLYNTLQRVHEWVGAEDAAGITPSCEAATEA
jgi:hypothetical protein